MILSKVVQVQARSRFRYWEQILNRPGLSYRDVIEVRIEDLPLNSNIRVDVRCDQCGSTFDRQYQLITKRGDLPHVCRQCKIVNTNNNNRIVQKGQKRPSMTGDRHPRWRVNKTERDLYIAEVRKFTRRHKHVYSKWENFDKIGRCGVSGAYQLDHIVSIRHGFLNGIHPSTIGDISNLQIITWEENRKKWF